MQNKQILKYILVLFIGSRLILLLLTFYGISIIPHYAHNGDSLVWPTNQINFWERWANWDGGHFRGVAERGYLPIQAAFFPFYPLLIKLFIILKFNSLWPGLLVSQVSAIIALFFLYKLVLLDFGEKVAQRAVFLLLIFPTSFYLNALYSESTFLALSVSAIYFARISKQKKLPLAFLLASLSAVTRLVGIWVIFSVFLENFIKKTNFTFKGFLKSKCHRFLIYLGLANILLNLLKMNLVSSKLYLLIGVLQNINQILLIIFIIYLILLLGFYLIKSLDKGQLFSLSSLWLLLSLLPFLGYIIYLHISQNDPLAFLNVEKVWQRTFSYPWDPVFAYFSYLKSQNYLSPGGSTQFLIELLFFVIAFMGLIFSFMKLRISYTIYFLATLLTPLFSGTLVAIHRYILVIFPLFIILALIKNEQIYKLWVIFSILFLGIFSVLYINGFWVS